MTTIITIITMADLNKSIVQLHLGPAVRPCGVRGVGRHHAGDQRHLDMHSGQGEGVSHQVYLIVQVIRDNLWSGFGEQELN